MRWGAPRIRREPQPPIENHAPSPWLPPV
jgi:hypothetical protein